MATEIVDTKWVGLDGQPIKFAADPQVTIIEKEPEAYSESMGWTHADVDLLAKELGVSTNKAMEMLKREGCKIDLGVMKYQAQMDPRVRAEHSMGLDFTNCRIQNSWRSHATEQYLFIGGEDNGTWLLIPPNKERWETLTYKFAVDDSELHITNIDAAYRQGYVFDSSVPREVYIKKRICIYEEENGKKHHREIFVEENENLDICMMQYELLVYGPGY